jgi:diguanylate cyclase (GGDEF)-like protein
MASLHLRLPGFAAASCGTAAASCRRPRTWQATILCVALASFPAVAAVLDTEREARRDEEVVARPEAALARLAAEGAGQAAATVAERCRNMTLRARAEIELGRFEAAQATAAELEAAAPPGAATCARAAALLVRAEIAGREGSAEAALERAIEGNRLATKLDDWRLGHWAADLLARDAVGRGDYDVAIRLREQQIQRARQAGDRRAAALAASRLSDIHFALGDADRAMAKAEDAWNDAVAAMSPWAEAEAKLSEAAAAERKGDHQRDRRARDQALAIARDAQSTGIERWVRINLADFALRHGEYAGALEMSRRSLALAEATQAREDIVSSLANTGFALLMLGRADDGRAHTDRAVALVERADRKAALALLLAEYGDYLARSGDHRRAVAAYQRERALRTEVGRSREAKIQHGMKAFYEAERQAQEVELLNRRNALQAVELDRQLLEQRFYAAMAVAALLALVVVLQLYRRQRATARGLEATNRTLAAAKDVDPLTGLYNRRHFHEMMRTMASHDRRQEGTPGAPQNALLLLDLDHFKRINDRHGHSGGDAVLIEIARRMRGCLRDDDHVVRWGGEEFLVWATLRPADHVHDIAGRLLDAVGGAPVTVGGEAIAVTTSIGYLAQPLPPDGVELSWREAFDLADTALYLAKSQGRNRGCGIAALRRAADGGAPDVGHDLVAAAAAGIVDLHYLHGPRVDDSVAELEFAAD